MKRIRRFLSSSLALGLAVSLVVPSSAFAELEFKGTTIISSAAYTYTQPAISGHRVVCVRQNNTTLERDVVVYSLRNGQQSVIGGSDGRNQDGPRISGDRVVWIDHSEGDGEVWYDDLGDSAPPRRLTNDTNDDVGADIDGNYVVWANGQAIAWGIRWYNIETGQYGTVTPSVPPVRPQSICVDRGRVAYWDTKESSICGIYVYDIDSATEYPAGHISGACIDSVSLYGDWVVSAAHANATPADTNVYQKNLRTGGGAALTTGGAAEESPCVFDQLFVWQTNARGNWDILARTWDHPRIMDVATSAADELYPDAYGHSVVYQIGTGSGSRIGFSEAELKPLRLAGANRYQTSVLISRNRFPQSGTAVIATGESFPDALAASALAGALRCPLLLTRKYGVPAEVMAELHRLGVATAYIVGSSASVAMSVQNQLSTDGISCVRIGGPNRYATAAALVGWIVDIRNSANMPNRNQAFFVRGDDFADALSVSPIAYALGTPILLVRTDGVPTETRDAIRTMGIQSGYVIGSTTAISSATKAALDSLLPGKTVRWGGANRYETSVICAKNAVDRGWLDYDTIGVATGATYPDALGGGAACGYYGSPILLTAPAFVPPAVHAFLHQQEFDFGGMEVYGGTSAVSAATFDQLAGHLD